MNCEHNWKIFKDSNLVGSGYLSFYCVKCLELRKVKKDYRTK